MVNLTYRQSTTPTVPTETTAKGAPLTNAEIDGNHKAISDELLKIQEEALALAIVLG